MGERIEWVSCGGQHSLLLTSQGRLFTWGRSMEGQCGHGARTATPAPQPVAALDKVPYPPNLYRYRTYYATLRYAVLKIKLWIKNIHNIFPMTPYEIIMYCTPLKRKKQKYFLKLKLLTTNNVFF